MLMRPAERGFSIVVEYLLENNANPNIVDHVRKNYLVYSILLLFTVYVIAVTCIHHPKSADEAYYTLFSICSLPYCYN